MTKQSKEIKIWKNNRGVATGRGGRGRECPPLEFSNQARSTNFSLKHQEYCFLPWFRNYTDHKFYNIYRVCWYFWKIYGGFSFFLTTKEECFTWRWTFWKGPILNAGPSEKFLYVDHPKEDLSEREFKP